MSVKKTIKFIDSFKSSFHTFYHKQDKSNKNNKLAPKINLISWWSLNYLYCSFHVKKKLFFNIQTYIRITLYISIAIVLNNTLLSSPTSLRCIRRMEKILEKKEVAKKCSQNLSRSLYCYAIPLLAEVLKIYRSKNANSLNLILCFSLKLKK